MGALKILKGGKRLDLPGEDNVDMLEVISEAAKFILACYSQPKCANQR